MKILHLVSGGDTGGAKTHLLTLLKALSSEIEVLFVCLQSGACYYEAKELGINTITLEQRGRYDMSVMPKLEKLIDEGAYDILHLHGARANFLAAKLKKRFKLPMCTTIHSDFSHDFDHHFLKKMIFTRLNKSALKKLDYYLTITENFKRDFIAKGFEDKKIKVVYNGISPEIASSDLSEGELLLKFGLTERAPCMIGSATRMHPVKGIDVLLGAASILKRRFIAKSYAKPPFQIVIAGSGPWEEKYHEMARELRIDDVLRFIGFTRDMEDFYKLIDINVLPSRSESFPYALLEGALRAKATVASKVGGIPEMIRDGVDGFLYENNEASALADKLELLIEDGRLRESLASSFHARVVSDFSDESMAKRHIEVYREIMEEMPRKIAICGYYGYQNSGDDAILKAILLSLKNIRKPIDITVLSKRPEMTEAEYGVRAVDRFRFWKVLGLLKQTDVLVMGGGSLLQDKTSNRSLYYYLGLMRLAKKKRVKVILYANGVGPISAKINRRLTKKILNSIDMLTIREKFSYDFVKSLGVDGPPMVITADPVFNLAESTKKPEVREKLRGLGLTEAPIVGVMFRSWKGEEGYTKKIAELCDYMVEKYGVQVLILPMKYPADLKVSTAIETQMRHRSHVIRERLLPEENMLITSEMSLVLGMRLHAVIYAAIHSVPFLGFEYDPKVAYYTSELGQPLVSDLTRMDMEVLKREVDELYLNREAYAEKLAARTRSLQELAMENVKYLERLL